MNLIPKGCANIGGELALRMEYCRNMALKLFASYSYHPFSPAEFQLLEEVWEHIPKSRRDRVLPLSSPWGEICCLRVDHTLSAVAYLATHFAPHEHPLRLCYADRVYAAPKAPQDNLEVNQVGIELLGWDGEGADVEVLTLLLRALDHLGVKDSVVVLGDTSIASYLFSTLPRAAAETLVDYLQRGKYVPYREMLERSDIDRSEQEQLLRFPFLKGDVSILEQAQAVLQDNTLLLPLQKLISQMERLGYAHRLRVDLGFFRDLGYYSGPVFNVYSAPNGSLLGGGGRYDGLLSEMDMAGQAMGFGLNLRELARCCRYQGQSVRTLLWAGQTCPAKALAYANRLSEKQIPFELSWHTDSQASLKLAEVRGYRWWIDSCKNVVTVLETGSTLSLDAFEREALPC